MCDSSAEKRRCHAPVLISQSMMMMMSIWDAGVQSIISMYLDTIIIVSLMSVAIIFMPMLAGLTAMIILLIVTSGSTERNVVFWPSFQIP